MMKYYLKKVVNGEDLTREEAANILNQIIQGDISPIQAGAFLTALRMKKESVDEIVGFIDTMEKHMIKVPLNDEDAIDLVGTGGDESYTFNVSTTASLVVAAGGVTVAKHGNRSISSKCGSADLLEALGVRIDLQPYAVKKCIEEIGMGFFFAPLYHPAMKAIAPVRKSLEMRTIFNILGPLLNPARVKRQLIGTFNLEAAQKVAEVLAAKNYKKACTIHSADGYDEISPFSETYIFEMTQSNSELRKYSFKPSQLSDINRIFEIKGHSPKENAQITLNILQGKNGPAREMTVLNSAFGFYVADKVKSIEEGIELAKQIIDSGSALAKLNELRQISNDLAEK